MRNAIALLLSAIAIANCPNRTAAEPFATFQYRTDFDLSIAQFTKATGIKLSADVIRQLHATTKEHSFTAIKAAISKFPVLHIVVQPEPPMDYSILVNGEEFTPAKPNEIVVPGGKTVVRVTRGMHNPCEWQGNVRTRETIHCKFPY